VTLGFLVLRKGYLKVMGALIQAALERRHDVVLLWDSQETKSGERVAEKDLAAWRPSARVVQWSRGEPFAPVVRAAGVRALVAPTLGSAFPSFGLESEVPALRAAGVQLYSVDYGLDTAARDPAGYQTVDVTFYATDWQRELHWKHAGFAAIGDRAALSTRSAVVGSTMLDQRAVVDRAAVRKRYDLDDRPVVLLLSLKMNVGDPPRWLAWGDGGRWRRAARALAQRRVAWRRRLAWARRAPRGNEHRGLVQALRRFCDANGAALVVKSREKNGDPAFLRRAADAFIVDESVYPYTSMELMSIADLCVHFQSAGVLEAAFAGVASLSVRVGQDHLRAYPTFDEFYGARPGSLQNFAGVVWSVTQAEAIERLGRARLGDFRLDPPARRAYVEKFVGVDDTRASQRVLDVIEGRAR